MRPPFRNRYEERYEMGADGYSSDFYAKTEQVKMGL